jgi:hypothetical protein
MAVPCQYKLAGDINEDCIVDFKDLASFAQNWMTNYDFLDYAPLASSWCIGSKNYKR